MTDDASSTQSTLTLAPGKRYGWRRRTGRGYSVRRRAGLAVAGGHSGREMADVRAQAEPPVAGLLALAWLLMAYRVSVEGETTVAGRAGIVVTGTARSVSRMRGLVTSMVLPWGELTPRPERVSVVVDRELGILLRSELSYPDETVRVTEFVGLEVGGAVDPSVFSPVAGSLFGSGRGGGRVGALAA